MYKKTFLLLFVVFSLNLSAQEFKTPLEYLNYIDKEQVLISKSMWKYTTTVAHSKNARRIDNTRNQLVKTIQNSSKKISDLKNGYKGDVEFRDQMLAYLSFSEKSINEEYDKIIDMQEVSEQSYDYMEAYIMMRDLVNEKINQENEKANLAQKTFAAKYGITINEDTSELSKKIKISNDVFEYHTQLYLIFFKANITDMNLSVAIEKKDLGAIQQNANSLLQYAEEGLEKLKTIPKYNNDNSMIMATKMALDYYKSEAESYIPKVVSFYMFNEKFEASKKTLEAKSQSDRTKEEVDNYNALVKQFNQEIVNYNKWNNSNFQEKSNVVNNWNSTGDLFISKHVPMN